MLVRIRFRLGPQVNKRSPTGRRLATGLAVLLTPAAALAGVVAFWRVAADLAWASSFAISSGPLSHWQVWLGAAVLLQFCSHVLNRYAKSGQTPASR